MAITYRGERFEGYNKPKRTSSHPSKSHAVLAKLALWNSLDHAEPPVLNDDYEDWESELDRISVKALWKHFDDGQRREIEGEKVRLIWFGQQGADNKPPRKGESEADKAKRRSFKARFAKDIAKGRKDKTASADYWADKVKW